MPMHEGSDKLDREKFPEGFMLCSDHVNTDPYEKPSWGGMVVYINGALKTFGATSYNIQYFTKTIIDESQESGTGGISGKHKENNHGVYVYKFSQKIIKVINIKVLMWQNLFIIHYRDKY
jgi:hypothetical protein